MNVFTGFAGTLIKAFFKGIMILVTTLLSPVINGVVGIFPVLSGFVSHAVTYLTTIVVYIPLCCSFLMIPRTALVMLFDYLIIKYTIYLTVRGVTFVVRTIQAFKVT